MPGFEHNNIDYEIECCGNLGIVVIKPKVIKVVEPVTKKLLKLKFLCHLFFIYIMCRNLTFNTLEQLQIFLTNGKGPPPQVYIKKQELLKMYNIFRDSPNEPTLPTEDMFLNPRDDCVGLLLSDLQNNDAVLNGELNFYSYIFRKILAKNGNINMQQLNSVDELIIPKINCDLNGKVDDAYILAKNYINAVIDMLCTKENLDEFFKYDIRDRPPRRFGLKRSTKKRKFGETSLIYDPNYKFAEEVKVKEEVKTEADATELDQLVAQIDKFKPFISKIKKNLSDNLKLNLKNKEFLIEKLETKLDDLGSDSIKLKNLLDDLGTAIGLSKVIIKSKNYQPGELEERIVEPSSSDNVILGPTCNGTQFGPYSNVFIPKDTSSTLTNKDVYKNSVKEMVSNAIINNENSLLLSYGASSSGKTYTLLNNKTPDIGITQCILETLDTSSNVELTAFQLYNGMICDVGINDDNINAFMTSKPYNNVNTYKYLYKKHGNCNADRGVVCIDSTDSYIAKVDLINFQNPDNDVKKHQNPDNDVKKQAFMITIKNFLTNYVKEADKQLFYDKLTEKYEDIKPKDIELEDYPLNFANWLLGRQDKQEIFDYLKNLIKLLNISSRSFKYKKIENINKLPYIKLNNNNIVSEFNKIFNDIIEKNRFTRSTLYNPDSSRSHLFIVFKINGIKLTVADLAGAEAPDEYISNAYKEGYFILDSLHQLQQIIQNYSNTGNLTNTFDILKPLSSGGKLNLKQVPYNIYKNIETLSATDCMQESMKYVLEGQGKPKIITFINTKTFFPDNAGIKKDDVCKITTTTLDYGMEILDPNYTNGFGLRKLKLKRKTSTIKLRKRKHRRSRSNKNIKNIKNKYKSLKKKKRTFKRSNKLKRS